MFKSGSIGVLLMTLLFGSGNFLTMERGFVADHANVIDLCSMPPPCNVYGFTDWYKVGGHCVKYFEKPLNFTDAEFSCRAKAPGAHLVSVHDKKDNDYLFSIVKKFNPNNLRIWIGGYELFKSGKFFWIDGSFWGFEIWAGGEPNHVYTNTEECVEMNWKEPDRWNDDSCSVEKSYICAFKQKDIFKPGSEEME